MLSRGALSLTVPANGLPADGVPPEVIVGVRPEHTHLWEDGRGLVGPIDARAEYVEMLGREALVGVIAGDDQRFTALADANTPVKPGDQVRMGTEPDHIYLFDASTQLARAVV